MLESRLPGPHYLSLDHKKASLLMIMPTWLTRTPWGIELRGKHRGLCVRKMRYTILRHSREHPKRIR